MKIFTHRGIWDSYPENSRSAIVEAFSQGFGVEIDIRFTADKRILIMHDEDLTRLCGVNEKIKDLSSEDILNIPFLTKPDEQPLFFDDLIPHIKSRKNLALAVHFKQNDQTIENFAILADLFKTHSLYEICFLFNLSLDSCRSFRDIDSQIKSSVIVSDNKFEHFVYLWDEAKLHSDLFDLVWAAEYKNLYKKEFFGEIFGCGKKVVTVSPELHRSLNHPKAYGYQEYWPKFLSYQVDGVCTDFPGEFSRFLANQGEVRRYGRAFD